MDDYFLGSSNKAILPPNAPAFLYLDCMISSEDQGPECQEVIYSFPTNLSPASLVIGLRGAFISFVKLSRDTKSLRYRQTISSIESRTECSEEIDGFYFLKYTSLNDETLRAGATIDSNGNLVVLILPTLLFDGSNHHLSEILIELTDYIQFFYGDLINAASDNSKELTKFLSLFFYNYSEWIDFLKAPENVSITFNNLTKIDKVLTSLESASNSFDYATKNAQINCRSTQIHGLALFSDKKVLVNHFSFPCLRKIYQYILLNDSNRLQNHTDSKISIRWLTINLICNNNEKKCRGCHAILLLQRNGLSLAVLLYSCEKIIEPPFDCLNMGKLCLEEAFQLNDACQYSTPNYQLARPESFFESAKSNYKEKEESGKYFQWFKTQMSPKSIRKVSQFGSSSSLNNIEDNNLSIQQNNHSQSVLTENGNSLFCYSYADATRSCTQILSENAAIKSEPMHQSVIKLLNKMFLKFSKMNPWHGSFSVIESSISFTCKIHSKSSADLSKSKAQELRFTIASHQEKNGSSLLICYNSNVPQNLKILLSRIYRKVHFYDTI